jgi:hypothetical protein
MSRGLALGWRSKELGAGARDCSTASQMDTGVFFSRPWRDADHSSPSIADVKNGGAVPSLRCTSSRNAPCCVYI